MNKTNPHAAVAHSAFQILALYGISCGNSLFHQSTEANNCNTCTQLAFDRGKETMLGRPKFYDQLSKHHAKEALKQTMKTNDKKKKKTYRLLHSTLQDSHSTPCHASIKPNLTAQSSGKSKAYYKASQHNPICANQNAPS